MDDPPAPPEVITRRPRPGPDDLARTLIAPAPAAFLAFWGVLIYVFGTQPIRPYTDGAWAPGDLVFLGVLGALIGLVARPLSAAAGITLGMSAAVALQLFVLAGQAHYQAVVVAALTESTWTWATAGALVLSICVLALGSLVTRSLIAVRRLAGGEPRSSTGSPTGRPDPWAMPGLAMAGLVVLVIAGLMTGISLLTTAHSAYLPAEDEPVVRVQLLDDGTLTSEPDAIPAGRATIIADLEDPLHLYGPLSPEDQAWLGGGRVNSRGREVYWTPGLRRVKLAEPGRYAFVVLGPDWAWPQDQAAYEAWDGTMPITAVHLLQVTAAQPRVGQTIEAGGDGGARLTLPAAAALATEGWAAAGSLLLAVRRYRRPRAAHVVVVVVAGLLSVAFIGMLTGLAISQAHSPF